MKTQRRIVVLQAGWVLIGQWHAATTTKPAQLTDASVVRKWGTTKGLGQLAIEGLQKETALDHAGIIVLDNPQAITYTIQCDW